MTKRRTFVFAATLAFLVFFVIHFIDFPGSVPRFKKVSGGEVLFDQTPSFTVDEIYKRLADYGEEGRKSYAFRNLTVDVLLPLSLLPFFFLLMLRALSSLQLNHFLRVSLLSVPFIYVVFDLIENAAVLVLLNNYPERLNLLGKILPYVTLVKRVASLLALFVPLSIFVILFLRRKFRKSRPPA